jgi:aminoglycoside phosphotransferase (APT) family kinase protein
LLAQCLELGAATTREDIEWVEEVLAHASPALAMPVRPALVHLDYSAGNIVGLKSDGNFQTTGIVDWMTAEIGHPESDLVRLLHLALDEPVLAQPFLDAHAAINPFTDGWRERFPVFMLLDRLLFWEYGQRNHVWFTPDQTLRSFAEPYVSILGET